MFREGLKILIASQPDMVLVAQSETGEEGVAQFRVHRPDVTLMDLALPGMNGVEAMIAIRAEDPDARIIILSTEESDVDIERALRAGAAGYVLKSAPKSELFAAIRKAHGRRE